jgi:hypothetical protein
MAINVYWAYAGARWQLAEEPELVSSIYYKKRMWDPNDLKTQVSFCPAIKKPFENLFAMKSLYDYEFEVTPDGVRTKMYDREFFEKQVVIRSLENRFFSYSQNFMFFTDEPSLEVTFGISPYLEDNNVVQRCMQIPGSLNIGKWFRATDMPFYLRKDYNSFKIERGEIYNYVQFHTSEKINFKQFRFTDNLEKMMDEGFALNFNRYMKTLENYYKAFKNKKFILREIKENLV